jgi:hypothetical protein
VEGLERGRRATEEAVNRRVALALLTPLASLAVWCASSSEQPAQAIHPAPSPAIIPGGGTYPALPYDWNCVPSAGQSLAVGGASNPNDAGVIGAALQLYDSKTTHGWYWYQGAPAPLGATWYPSPPSAQPGCLFTVVDAGVGTTNVTQPTWCTTLNCTTTDLSNVTAKCTSIEVSPYATGYPLDAGTLSLVPYASPARPVQQNGMVNQYPTNIFGEAMAWAADLEIFTLTGSTPVTAEVAVGGSSMNQDSDGGAVNSFAALAYEITAQKALATAAGKTYGVPFFFITNGAADAQNYAYTWDVLTYIAQVRGLVANVTGQVPAPLAYMTQQAVTPIGNVGPPTSAFEQLYLSRFYEDRAVMTKPEWLGPYAGTNTQHETTLAYDQNGEKNAEAALIDLNGSLATGTKWRPVSPNDVSIVSSTNLLVTLDVPFPPLQWITTFGQPHQSGPLSNVWANGHGFEVIQNIANVSGATNATPIVIATQQAHGLSTGNVVNVANVSGNAAANSQSHGGNWTITVVDSTHFSLNTSAPGGSNQSYDFGGQVRLAVTAATNATPIVITTGTAHGLSTGAVVGIDGVLGNAAANGTWVVTVVDSTHFSLNTSVGSGAFTVGGGVSVFLPITSTAIQNGNQVLVTTPSAIGNGVSLAVAVDPDDLVNQSANLPARRCTNLADSDTFTGRYTGTVQPNYAVISYDPVPFHTARLLTVAPATVIDTLASPVVLSMTCNRGCAGMSAITLKATGGALCSGSTIATLTSISATDQSVTASIPAGTYADGLVDVCPTAPASPTGLQSAVNFQPLNLISIFPPGNLGTSCAAVGVYTGSGANCSGGVSSSLTDTTTYGQNMPAVGSPTCTATGSSPTVQPTFSVSSGNYYDWGASATYRYYTGASLSFTQETICHFVVAKTSSTGAAEFVSVNNWGPIELRMSNSAPTNEPQMISNNASVFAQWGSSTTGAWHEYVACSTGQSTGTVKISVDNGAFVTTSIASGGSSTGNLGLNSIGARRGNVAPISAEMGLVGIVTCPPGTFPAAGDFTNARTYAHNTWGTP